MSNKIPWKNLEKEFAPLYSKIGRPSKPVRLMVSLLLLKQIYNLGDETVVSAWVHNPYWQYFSGFTTFQWNFPIEPTDLVHFRKRIGKKGLEKIFKISIDLHGKRSLETQRFRVKLNISVCIPQNIGIYRSPLVKLELA